MTYTSDIEWTDQEMETLRMMKAQGKTFREIGEAVGRTAAAANTKWKRRNNKPQIVEERPIPADFVAVAATKRVLELCAHYRAGRPTVNRWIAETGATLRPIAVVEAKKLKAPAHFKEMARGKSLAELEDYYNISRKTIKRWCVEAGIAVPRLVRQWNPTTQKSAQIPLGDASLAGRAADHLRRWMPVYRARTVSPKAPADLWVAGLLHLTTQDMIAKAEAKGFNAGEWSRIAA